MVVIKKIKQHGNTETMLLWWFHERGPDPVEETKKKQQLVRVEVDDILVPRPAGPYTSRGPRNVKIDRRSGRGRDRSNDRPLEFRGLECQPR